MLVEYFLKRKMKGKIVKKIHSDAFQSLLAYDWPGNIRELEHAIEGAMLLSHDDLITASDFILTQNKITSDAKLLERDDTSVLTIDEVERIHIEQSLKKFKFSRNKTANALGITQKTLYLKIKRYKIPVEDKD